MCCARLYPASTDLPFIRRIYPNELSIEIRLWLEQNRREPAQKPHNARPSNATTSPKCWVSDPHTWSGISDNVGMRSGWEKCVARRWRDYARSSQTECLRSESEAARRAPRKSHGNLRFAPPNRLAIFSIQFGLICWPRVCVRVWNPAFCCCTYTWRYIPIVE